MNLYILNSKHNRRELWQMVKRKNKLLGEYKEMFATQRNVIASQRVQLEAARARCRVADRLALGFGVVGFAAIGFGVVATICFSPRKSMR